MILKNQQRKKMTIFETAQIIALWGSVITIIFAIVAGIYQIKEYYINRKISRKQMEELIKVNKGILAELRKK